ncbi:MAG TPA: ATP-binding cassette domain-containing protein [Pseudonocardiaceae bacterium]
MATATTTPAPAAARRPRALPGWIVLAAVTVALYAFWGALPAEHVPTLITGMVLLFLAYSWNIVGGILGELSLVTMVFWAMGAYTLVLVMNSERSAWLPLVVAAIAAAAFAWLIVVLARLLGLDGLYLAVFTLIVYEIARSLVIASEPLGRNEGVILTEFTSLETSAYLLIGLVMIGIAANYGILRSRIGRRWLAIKDDPTAAEATGVFTGREKARAYAISAFLTALGGGVQAYYLGYAQPGTALSVELLIAAVLAVYVGGPGTIAGPLLGTTLVYGLSALATSVSTDINITLYAQLLQYALAFAIIWLLSTRRASRLGLVSWLGALVRRRPPPPPETAPPPADAGVVEAVEAAAPHEPGDVVLSVRGVDKAFGRVRVLRDVDLDLRAGEIVGLMGPNGAGKTTLCNVVTGVIAPDAGTVTLAGEDITRLSTPRRFHRGIARTFQSARLFVSLTVYDNVAVGGAGGAGDHERVHELLTRYGIDGHTSSADAPTFVRRLAEVARAMVGAKRVLILDEPLAGLTPQQHEVILRGVREVAADGTAVLLVEHLIQAVAPVCDRLVVMADGAVIADGPPHTVLRDDRVVDAYLGSTAVAEDEEVVGAADR